MNTNRIQRIDNMPVLVSVENEKHYFTLSKQNLLNRFSYNKGHWALIESDLFGREIKGFDIVLDRQGKICILGYEKTGGLLLLPAADDRTVAELFYKDNSKKTGHLSVCLDKKDDLHVLCLSLDEQRKMWWLLYLYQKENKWQKPCIIDFGYHFLDQSGLIIKDLKDDIFILHRLAVRENYGLVLRKFPGKSTRPGKTVFLSEKEMDCYFPAFVFTPDNTLHITWISHENNVLFLNYIQKTPTGEKKCYFSMELPRDSFSMAPLYFVAEKLFMVWKKGHEIFYLASTNMGENWSWEGQALSDSKARLIRFRSANVPWQGEYVFVSGDSPNSPPLEIWYPENILSSQAGKNNLLKEFQTLEHFSLGLLTHAGNLQSSNASLKEKLKRKEDELAKIFSWNASMKEKAEKDLKNKKVELQQAEVAFKKTLENLHKKIANEKKEIVSQKNDLTEQVQGLRKRNEALEKENIMLLKETGELKRHVVSLIKEIEELKTKKSGFFFKIFNRHKD